MRVLVDSQTLTPYTDRAHVFDDPVHLGRVNVPALLLEGRGHEGGEWQSAREGRRSCAVEPHERRGALGTGGMWFGR